MIATHLVTVDDGHKAKEKAAKKGSEDRHHQVVLWLVLCIDNSWCWWLHNLHAWDNTNCSSVYLYMWIIWFPRSMHCIHEQPVNRAHFLERSMPNLRSHLLSALEGKLCTNGPVSCMMLQDLRDYVPPCSTPLLHLHAPCKLTVALTCAATGWYCGCTGNGWCMSTSGCLQGAVMMWVQCIKSPCT